MPALALRVSVWMRGHLARLAAAAVVIGIAGGLAMGIVAGVRRTASAPDRYTAHAGGDPAMLITQFSGRPLTAEVAQLPGVASTQSWAFVTSYLVSPIDGTLFLEPDPFAGDGDVAGARLVEGRFAEPAVPNEFTVNRQLADLLAEEFGTHVGDDFQVASYSQEQVATNFDPFVDVPEIARFTARLVGITESPGEFDEPKPQIVFSPSFLDAHPDVGVVQTLILPHLDDGVDPAAVLDAVRQLPDGADAFALPLRIVTDSARRAVRYQVTALWLVAALSILAAMTVIVQVVARTVRLGHEERQSMLAIGWRPRDLGTERAIEGAVAAVMAAPIAAIVVYVLSAVFPLGVLRMFEPDPGMRVDWLVTILGLLALAALVAAAAAIVGARRASFVAGAAHGNGGALAAAVSARGAAMPLSVGAGFAATGAAGRRPLGMLVAGAAGVAALVGSVIVGLSLTNIVDRPARWGVNYDQLFGNMYADPHRDVLGPILDNPDVTAVAGATFGAVTVNGSDTSTVAYQSAKGGLGPTVLRGRAPMTADDIALGAEVADRLDVDVGDTVEVAGSSGASRLLGVVGIVVVPTFGGDSAAMTFDGYHVVNPESAITVALVNFGDGAPEGVVDAVAAANYSPPRSTTPPTSIRALERVTAAPLLLGLVLAALLLIAGAYRLTTSVRARQRDLAILRALGSDGRQLRGAVHWQASLVTAMLLLLGVPLGVLAGRTVVTSVTGALGIVPGVSVPVLMVAGIGLAALLIANALAVLPAIRAAQVRATPLSLDV